MSKEEELLALKQLISIQKSMEWKVSDMYKKLEDNFRDSDFPLEDTFRKQYSLTGKGSKKYFIEYLDHIYNLDEVKTKLTKNSSKEDRKFLIMLGVFILPFLFLADYHPHDVSLLDVKKECMQNCIKQVPNYREDKDGLSLDDFRSVRFVKKLLN